MADDTSSHLCRGGTGGPVRGYAFLDGKLLWDNGALIGILLVQHTCGENPGYQPFPRSELSAALENDNAAVSGGVIVSRSEKEARGLLIRA